VEYDFFNFVFHFAIDELRGWGGEVLAVNFVFTIRG
jgi:hypothetical protein